MSGTASTIARTSVRVGTGSIREIGLSRVYKGGTAHNGSFPRRKLQSLSTQFLSRQPFERAKVPSFAYERDHLTYSLGYPSGLGFGALRVNLQKCNSRSQNALSSAAGFAALEQIGASRVVSYQPYWAARGHLLLLLDRMDEARAAFTRAASLTDGAALRTYLLTRADTVRN